MLQLRRADQADGDQAGTAELELRSSIVVAPGEHLAPMVIQAARLAATHLPIARRLRPADKGPARL